MKDSSLAILADAYTSPLLLNSLIRGKVPVWAQTERLKNDLETHCPGLTILSEEMAVQAMSKPGCRIYINSDEALAAILEHSGNQPLVDNINLLSDRGSFRRLLSDIIPDFFFREAGRDGLRDIKLPPGRDYIIKPASGLFKGRARLVKPGDDLGEKAEEILLEAREHNHNKFIIEEYIIGEEFSCDAYFNSSGKPSVLGIYAHPQINDDFRDVVLYTSSKVVKRMRPRLEDFLRKLSSKREIQNLPLHIDLRLKGNMLVPLAAHPLRFGGFSLSDMLFFAFDINPYRHYFGDLKPEWKEIIARSDGKIYFWVLSCIQGKAPEGAEPDHEEYANTFEDLMGYCKLDPRRYPAFSIAFGRTEKVDGAQKYLSFDFGRYLSLNQSSEKDSTQ